MELSKLATDENYLGLPQAEKAKVIEHLSRNDSNFMALPDVEKAKVLNHFVSLQSTSAPAPIVAPMPVAPKQGAIDYMLNKGTQGALTAVSGASIIGGGLAHAFGFPEAGDKMFDTSVGMRKAASDKEIGYGTDDAAQGMPTRIVGGLVGALPTLAAMMVNPAIGIASTTLPSMNDAADNMDAGLSTSATAGNLAIDTAGNLAGAYLPAGLGKTAKSIIATSVPLNMAQGAITDYAKNKVTGSENAELAKKYDATNVESRIIDAMFGVAGGVGAVRQNVVKAKIAKAKDAKYDAFVKQEQADTKNRSDNIIADAQEVKAKATADSNFADAIKRHEPILKANGIDTLDHPDIVQAVSSLEQQRVKVSQGEEADDAYAAQLQAKYDATLPKDEQPTAKDSAFNKGASDFVYDRSTLDKTTGQAAPIEIDKTGTYATNPELLARNRGRETALTDEQVGMIADKTGLSNDDIRGLSPESQQRIYKKHAEATGDGVLLTSNANESGDGGAYSPQSKLNVPSDRDTNYGVAEDKTARALPTDQEVADMKATPEAKQAAARKQVLLDELDQARQQSDNLANNEGYKELKRKADAGEPMLDREKTLFNNHENMIAKNKKHIFDTEGRIYDVEAKSELGSKSASGTSDRPFKADTDPHAGMYEERAREQAKTAHAEALDKLEAEWKARSDAQTERDAKAKAGERQSEEDNSRRQERNKSEYKYSGSKKGTSEHAPLEGGAHPTDEFDFVKSDNGNPLHFKHQRDAGRWILGKGNKGNHGQVFEVHNSPTGDGFTVKVSHTDGAKSEPTGATGMATTAKPAPKAWQATAHKTEHKNTASGRRLIDFIKKAGGINPKHAKDAVGEGAFVANKESPFLFRKGGMVMDDLVQHLVEGDYISEAQKNHADDNLTGGAHQLARDLINDALSGKETHTLDSNDGERAYFDKQEAEHNWKMENDPAYKAEHEKNMAEDVNKSFTNDILPVDKLGKELGFIPMVLKGRKVSIDVDVGGKTVSVEHDALTVLSDAHDRVSALTELMKCIG